MDNEPTRLDSGDILDMVLTSNSSLISTINTVTGMSDHETILFDIVMNPIRENKPPHKVEVTKEVTKSYGSYINNIIGESLTTNSKKKNFHHKKKRKKKP